MSLFIIVVTVINKADSDCLPYNIEFWKAYNILEVTVTYCKWSQSVQLHLAVQIYLRWA